MPGPRHIVTGNDANGRSHIVEDGPVTTSLAMGGLPGFEFLNVWSTKGPGIADSDGPSAAGDIFPPPGGTRFHRIQYPSGFGVAEPDDDAAAELARIRIHRSDSIDFGIVLEGELTLVLEDGSETVMRKGDLVIQNGTVHGWRNTGAEPAVALFVMVGTDPDES
jgi:hypothetical protein